MKKKLLTIEWLINNHLPFLEKFGLDEKKIRDYYETWKVGKQSISINDYFWHILQKIIEQIAVQSQDEIQACELNIETYFIMWNFLRKVERKNANHVFKAMQLNKLRLAELQSGPYKKEVIFLSGHCCPYCNELNGKKFSFEEMIQGEYLGSSNCTNEYGCNCIFVTQSCRDEQGRFIRKIEK